MYSVLEDSVFYQPSPFNVTSISPSTPRSLELVSYRGTPQQHYDRLSREMGGTGFALERIEEMRNNITFVRFFKGEATPGETTTMLEDFTSSGDDQDADFHIVLPEDDLTTNHPRKLGQHLGQNPSIVYGCAEDCELIDQEMEDVEVKEAISLEEARQTANAFAAAAEALDT
ncbi:hypothetical protein BGZ50_000556, partial [Haplosporangium sp. Z 11]